MKTILDVEDDVEFLGMIYKAMDSITGLVNKVGVNEIRSRLPEFDAEDDDAAKRKKISEQVQKNLLEMAKGFLVDYPAETIAVIHNLIVLEKGEKYPQGFDLLVVLMKCIKDERVVDFLLSLSQLNQMN